MRDEVEADVLELKKAAAQENTLRELKADAEITAPEGSTYSYENPTVARVGDYDIRAAELDRSTYLNPQLQQLITPDFAEIIATSVRPNVLDQLIDEELAYQGAGELDGTFAGPRSAVAQSALNYVGRDAQATDAQIRTYYQNNEADYTVPPFGADDPGKLPRYSVSQRFPAHPDRCQGSRYQDDQLGGRSVGRYGARRGRRCAGNTTRGD